MRQQDPLLTWPLFCPTDWVHLSGLDGPCHFIMPVQYKVFALFAESAGLDVERPVSVGRVAGYDLRRRATLGPPSGRWPGMTGSPFPIQNRSRPVTQLGRAVFDSPVEGPPGHPLAGRSVPDSPRPDLPALLSAPLPAWAPLSGHLSVLSSFATGSLGHVSVSPIWTRCSPRGLLLHQLPSPNTKPPDGSL